MVAPAGGYVMRVDLEMILKFILILERKGTATVLEDCVCVFEEEGCFYCWFRF